MACEAIAHVMARKSDVLFTVCALVWLIRRLPGLADTAPHLPKVTLFVHECKYYCTYVQLRLS